MFAQRNSVKANLNGNTFESYMTSITTDLGVKKENGTIYINTKKFNEYSEAMRYRLVRMIINELLGNTQNIEMVHVKDTCKLIETGVTGKQYILGNKYKVLINKHEALFIVNSKM